MKISWRWLTRKADPVLTLKTATMGTTTIVMEHTSREERARVARVWLPYWRTCNWGTRDVGDEAELIERRWIEAADKILEEVKQAVPDANMFNTAIGRGLVMVSRLTDRAIHEAGEEATRVGGVLFWSDLVGLLVVQLGDGAP